MSHWKSAVFGSNRLQSRHGFGGMTGLGGGGVGSFDAAARAAWEIKGVRRDFDLEGEDGTHLFRQTLRFLRCSPFALLLRVLLLVRDGLELVAVRRVLGAVCRGK